ncbi:DMT family transporter [Candidatus Woesearchaeota archaeon]|nr:DMT family transporter [Candidatus Woesearchaeota archaeon]
MENKKGLMLVFGTAIISGFSIFVNSYAIQGTNAPAFVFLKNLLVALMLFAILAFFGSFKELKKLTKKQWYKLVAIGFIGGSIPFILFFKGLQMIGKEPASVGSFIHKTIFIYAAILAIIFLKEKINKWLIAGALLILSGTYLFATPKFSLVASQTIIQGMIFVLAATMMWALENVIAKHVLKELSGTIVAFGRMFIGSIFILAYLIATGELSAIAKFGQQHYLWIFVTAMFLLLYVLTYYNGLKLVNVTTATSVLSIGAPITSLLALAFKGQQINPYQIYGVMLIFTGVISIVWMQKIVFPVHKILKVKAYGRG